MTTPRDRVSYGFHAFPFFGLQVPGQPPFPLPLVPLRLRTAGGHYGRPFNAILDTGSTRTLIPNALAVSNGLRSTDVEAEVHVVGGTAKGTEVPAELAIVDAHYPEVSRWEIADVIVLAMRDADLEIPVIGWDVLGLFELGIDRLRERISMRLHHP
jgi:Aspartyl protease